MYVEWQEMPIVEMRRADKATRYVCVSVAKCPERRAAVCDAGLQPCKRCNDWRKLL